MINRRVLLAPALPRDKRKNDDADVKKLLPTLDIGSHINAAAQPRLKAGAQRTLEGVGCSRLFGWDLGSWTQNSCESNLGFAQRALISKYGLTDTGRCENPTATEA